MEKDLIYILYSDVRTVFRLKDIAMLMGETNSNSLKKKMNYYVGTGRLQNPRKGLYCKPNYNPQELACRIFVPAYISLEYVLQQAGVVFQYGLGELVNPQLKTFFRNKLRTETIMLLRFYKEFPIM